MVHHRNNIMNDESRIIAIGITTTSVEIKRLYKACATIQNK